MKIRIDKYGWLWHEYPGGRVVPILCPFASVTDDETPARCGDWCKLWQEPVPWTRREYLHDEDGDITTGEKLTEGWSLVDCQGYEHLYDELIDEREGAQKENDNG